MQSMSVSFCSSIFLYVYIFRVYNGHNSFCVKHFQSARDHFCHGCPNALPSIGFVVGVFLIKICWLPSSPLKNSFIVLMYFFLFLQKTLDLARGRGRDWKLSLGTEWKRMYFVKMVYILFVGDQRWLLDWRWYWYGDEIDRTIRCFETKSGKSFRCLVLSQPYSAGVSRSFCFWCLQRKGGWNHSFAVVISELLCKLLIVLDFNREWEMITSGYLLRC